VLTSLNNPASALRGIRIGILADCADHPFPINAFPMSPFVCPTKLPNIWTAFPTTPDKTPLLHACLLRRSCNAGEILTQRTYRGGLSPARLRRVKEFVYAKIEDELSLSELAQSVGLSIAHLSEMFRKSMGETPHQFVLRLRVERAKEMLRSAESRVLDVAIACGFKTQQHFARVFRQLCGTSPTEYRIEFQGHVVPRAPETYFQESNCR